MTDDGPDKVTPTNRRLIEGSDATADDAVSVMFHHTVFCQTGLPYRDPGDEVRVWSRKNGQVGLRIEAGSAWNPDINDFVQLGLPFGAKPRLLLAYLNAEAMRTGEPEIEVEGSLTAFVRRLKLDPMGRNIRIIKEQLSRLAASSIRLGMSRGREAVTIKSEIVSAFSLWWPKEDGQRLIWPTSIRLSDTYFKSLTRHAVPLHDRALMALSGSSMALDIYCWLAQRLHRIEWGEPAFVPWAALKEQFGWNYDRMDKFKAVFRQTLKVAHSQYRAADIELDDKGMTLRHSPPPVKGRTILVVNRPSKRGETSA